MTESVDIETFVGALPDRHLACRRLGHSWRHHTVTQDRQGFSEALRCSSCHTMRIDELTLSGHLVSRRYQYATGYQATHVTGGVKGNRDMFRLEAVVRLVEKAQAPADVPKPRRKRRLSVAG